MLRFRQIAEEINQNKINKLFLYMRKFYITAAKLALHEMFVFNSKI